MPDPQFLSLDQQTYTQSNKKQDQQPIKDLIEQTSSTNEESQTGNETTDLTEVAKQIVDIIVQKKPNSPGDFKSLYEEIELKFKNTTIKKIHNESEKNLGSSDIIARTDTYLQTIKLLSKKYFHTSENDRANLESLQNRMDNFFGENDEEDSTRQHLLDETKEQIESTVAFENNLKRYPVKTFDGGGQELIEYCKTISQKYLKTKDLKSFDETQKLLLEIYAARLAQTNQEPELLENLAFDFISEPQTSFEKEIVIAALSILISKKEGLDELEKEILQKSVTKMGSYESSDGFDEKLLELYRKEILKIKSEPTEAPSEYEFPGNKTEAEDSGSSGAENSGEGQSLTVGEESTQTQTQANGEQTTQNQTQTNAAQEAKTEEFVSSSVIENRKMEKLLNEILPQPYVQAEVIRVPTAQPAQNSQNAQNAQSTQTDENSTTSSAQSDQQNSTPSTETNQQTTENQGGFSETSTYHRKSEKINKPPKVQLTLGKELNTAGICTKDYFDRLKKLGNSVKKSCSKGIGEGFLTDLEQFYQRYKSTIKAIESGGPHSRLYDDKLVISDTIELSIRKLMRSIIGVYNSPGESEKRKETCGKLLRELMGFLRTKEDPEVNEQKNRERNLDAAAMDEAVYTIMNAAFTITQGKNRELIKRRLNDPHNPGAKAYMDIKKEAKKYGDGKKSYGSKKKDYYLMGSEEKTKTQKSILFTLTRFIGISLFNLGDKLEESIKNDLNKLYFDEGNQQSLISKIDNKSDLKDVSDQLEEHIKKLESKQGSNLFNAIRTHILSKFTNFPNFAQGYDKLVERIEIYYRKNLKNDLDNADFSSLSKRKLFVGIRDNKIQRISN